MTIQVRRGDTRTLTMTELAAQAGVTLGNFQAGDVVEFSLRTRLSDSAATIYKTSASGGVTYVNGTATGTVLIVPADWAIVSVLRTMRDCPWDVQLTRAGVVTTLMVGVLDLLPDVTR